MLECLGYILNEWLRYLLNYKWQQYYTGIGLFDGSTPKKLFAGNMLKCAIFV